MKREKRTVNLEDFKRRGSVAKKQPKGKLWLLNSAGVMDMANKKHKDDKKPFKWKHSVGEIILWLVRWYCRYALSYADLKEMATERGLKRLKKVSIPS